MLEFTVADGLDSWSTCTNRAWLLCRAALRDNHMNFKRVQSWWLRGLYSCCEKPINIFSTAKETYFGLTEDSDKVCVHIVAQSVHTNINSHDLQDTPLYTVQDVVGALCLVRYSHASTPRLLLTSTCAMTSKCLCG